MTDDRRRARTSTSRTYHVYTGPIPHGGLVRITESVSVTSPEMSIATMGRHLSDCLAPMSKGGPRANELAAMRTCMRACGIQHAAPKGDQEPLTSARRLQETVEKLRYAQGLPLLRKALPFVADGAPDDATIWLYQLFCLPYRYGSLGLPAASMERRDLGLVLGASWQEDTCSLAWPKERVALVVAKAEHPLVKATMGQRSWFDAPSDGGWSVLCATTPCMGDTQTIFAIATRLSALLGYSELRRRNVQVDLMMELMRATPLPITFDLPMRVVRAGTSAMAAAGMHGDDPEWDDILKSLA